MMTVEQKKIILGLCSQGIGYRKISSILFLNENTVKSFLRKHGKVSGHPKPERETDHKCLYCGTPVPQNPGRKEKKFCSDACRNKWWNDHQDLVRRRAVYHFTCQFCGKVFYAYGNAHRKYCCHACYIKSRFGEVRSR